MAENANEFADSLLCEAQNERLVQAQVSELREHTGFDCRTNAPMLAQRLNTIELTAFGWGIHDGGTWQALEGQSALNGPG